MSAHLKNAIQAEQTKKKKPTRPIAADSGSNPANGPGRLSKHSSLLASVPDSGPPKIRDWDKPELDDPSLRAGLARAFGTKDLDLICQLMPQVFSTNPSVTSKNPEPGNSLLATLYDIAPKDALEGLLAVQMVGVHELAMRFLARGVAGGQSHEQVDANTNRAVRLLRTFTAQMEALNRHRGQIGQQMVVGNVNVNDGGQAIVGPVNCPGPGKVSEDNEKKKAG